MRKEKKIIEQTSTEAEAEVEPLVFRFVSKIVQLTETGWHTWQKAECRPDQIAAWEMKYKEDVFRLSTFNDRDGRRYASFSVRVHPDVEQSFPHIHIEGGVDEKWDWPEISRPLYRLMKILERQTVLDEYMEAYLDTYADINVFR